MLRITLISILLSTYFIFIHGVSRKGSYSQQPYLANYSFSLNSKFYSIGMEYNSNLDLIYFGTTNFEQSTNGGKIYSTPFPKENFDIINEQDMTLVFNGDRNILSIFNLKFDKSNSSYIWATTGSYPANSSTPCGVAKINLNNGKLEDYFDFTPYRNSNTNVCLAMDLVFDDFNNLYVTDLYGYQIYKISTLTNIGDKITIPYQNIQYLCNDKINTCPSTSIIPLTNITFINGPSGIEYVNNKYLLVTVGGTRLVQISLDTTDITNNYLIISQTPTDGLQGVTNLILTLDQSKLFLTGSGTNGSILITSTDQNLNDWSTIMVHTAYNANCFIDGVSNLIIKNTDVYAFCSNNYGSPPYNITVLRNILNISGIELLLSSQININNLKPEGLEYDQSKNNIILSSVNGGQLSGVSASAFNEKFNHLYTYVNGSEQAASTVGLQLAPPNSNGEVCFLYACIGFGVDPALAYYDICQSSLIHVISFENVASEYSTPNDLVIVNNIAYVTDSGGSQIWSIYQPNIATSQPKVFTNSAETCLYPNGIEAYKNKYLLVGCSNGLWRLTIETKQGLYIFDSNPNTQLPNELTLGFDGIIFSNYLNGIYQSSSNNENNDSGNSNLLLYGASNFPTVGRDRVVVMSSNDDWTTCDVLFIFRGNCPGGYMSTIAYTGENMFVLCTDYYKNGPYEIRGMNNSNYIVTNGNIIYKSNNDNKKDGDNNNSKKHIVLILSLSLTFGILGLICIVVIIYMIYSRQIQQNYKPKGKNNPLRDDKLLENY